MVWVATRAGNVGASAPAALTSGAATAIAVTTRRRPMRSARMANGRASTMPARTREPPTATPVSPTPKSSAANATVWVNNVLTNADDIEAAASRPSTVSWRGSRRSAYHHGVGDVVDGGLVGARAPAGERPAQRQGEEPGEPRQRPAGIESSPASPVDAGHVVSSRR